MSARVLVVDDDPAILKVLTQTLQLEDYEVITATDGEMALDVLAADIPDLVVLDVMMPKRDGLDVLRTMRADPRTAEIPVVLLTARSSPEDMWEGWQQGVDYYMTKPFDVDELLRFMEHVLSQRSS